MSISQFGTFAGVVERKAPWKVFWSSMTAALVWKLGLCSDQMMCRSNVRRVELGVVSQDGFLSLFGASREVKVAADRKAPSDWLAQRSLHLDS